MSHKKTHVKKGDLVEVTSGEHSGKQGHVLQVLASQDRVLVEGVRMIKKSIRPTQDKPQGGFAEREGGIHISNVKLVESSK